MSEFRRDPLSGRWFVLAAERAKRPEAFYRPPRLQAEGTDCPFCPGRESESTEEVLRFDNPDGSWAVRVVVNKFADMADPTDASREAGDALHRRKVSAGFAEVLIEAPDHGATFDRHGPAQAALIVKAAQERYRHLAAVPGVAVVMPFRNYLPESGASLMHPHGQILAASHVPPIIAAEASNFAESTRCLGCELVAAEAGGPRVIARVGDYLLLAPYASRSAYEILILPEPHAHDFAAASAADLAAALQDGFRRLRRVLGDPPCNLWIHCRPTQIDTEFHWHAHLTPRLTVEGAWELGTGLAVNVVPPEQAASELRAGDGA